MIEELKKFNMKYEAIPKQTIFERIKNSFIHIILADRPSCDGYKYWTDCGYEYDCGYGDTAPDCEDCVCNKELGGRIDPRTGKKFRYFFKLREILND